MTLLLKSDKTATRNIGNLNGVAGPGDFTILADFERGIYRLGVGTARETKTLAEMLVCSRVSNATYVDALGVRQTVGNDTPRIDYRTVPGRHGLLSEASRRNYLLNSSTPANQTLSGLVTGDYILWVEGSGSAAVAGDVAVPPAAATAGNPVIFNVISPGTVNITVTGVLTLFQMEKADDSSAPTAYIPTVGAGVTRSADIMRLSPAALAQVSQTEGTMVAHAIAPKLITGASGGKHLLRFSRNASANGAIQMLTSAYVGNVATVTGAISDVSGGPQMSASAGTMNAANPLIALMAYKNNDCAVQMKSTVGVDTVVALPTGMDLFEIGGTRWAPTQWNGIITKLVYYPRRLTSAEMSTIALQA